MQARFGKYAWFVVAYNLFVILWGAYVRATGSGAGCGEHWPLCNGEVLPRSPRVATLIEFTHRLTSGLALVFVIGLVVLAFRWHPKESVVRRAAGLSLFFTLTEALIGAGLVLLGHVAANQSIARGWSLGLHLVNTLILLACLVSTAWLSNPRPTLSLPPISPRMRASLIGCAALFLLVGISGAIAALGDTLFRVDSLSAGMRQDFDASSHPFVRLRVLHPALAITAAGVLLALSLSLLDEKRWGVLIPRLAYGVAGATVAQVILGGLNLALLAPVWLQLTHLLMADLLWIALVLLVTELARVGAERRQAAEPELLNRAEPRAI